MTDSIFISYRRSDTAGHALSLYNYFRLWFDAEQLFFDQDSIGMGERFPESIEAAIDATQVVLVVIGPDWLTSLNERVARPGIDYVREEISRALTRNTASGLPHIVPVLMGGATMPSADEFDSTLRGELSGLLNHNAHTFSFNTSLAVVDTQFAHLRDYLGAIEGVPAPQYRPPKDVIPPRHIPHNPNPNFTGREQELDALHQALTTEHRTALTALSGLGGVGKTQLALEYSYKHTDDYAGIWWFYSETPEALGNDMRLLADALNVAPGVTDQDDLIAAVHTWLEQQSAPWLLIYDNAKAPDAVLPFLPARRGLHHIIVTSRHTGGWGGVAEPLEIKPLERDESVAFLLARTRQDDTSGAERLADALGDLPLALEQAGATIDDSGLSIERYLSMFETHRVELLKERSGTADYPDSVATTWNIAFKSVKEKSPLGASLLNLLSFYAPDAIPHSIIADGCEALPDSLSLAASDPLALNDAVKALRRRSLIETSGSNWSIHRLVQAVTRDALGEEASTWAATAAEVVRVGIPGDVTNPETWERTSKLLPHAVAVSVRTEHYGVALETTSRLLDIAGRYLGTVRVQLQQAADYHKRALDINRHVHGEEHASTAGSYNNVALSLNSLGRYEEAEPLYRKSLEIFQRVHGEEHSHTATSYSNVAMNLNAQGRYEEADPLYRQGLEIFQRVLGEEHPHTARSYNNVALNLDAQGRYEEAELLHRQGLEIFQRVLGEEHPSTAASYDNVASNLDDQGRYEEAESLYRQGLEICRRLLGEEHPNTARSYNNVASNLNAQGRYEEAEPLCRQGLEICQRVLGEEHPSTATSYNNVASNLDDQGRYEEAEPLYLKALNIFEARLPSNHPHIGIVRSSIAKNQSMIEK